MEHGRDSLQQWSKRRLQELADHKRSHHLHLAAAERITEHDARLATADLSKRQRVLNQFQGPSRDAVNAFFLLIKRLDTLESASAQVATLRRQRRELLAQSSAFHVNKKAKIDRTLDNVNDRTAGPRPNQVSTPGNQVAPTTNAALSAEQVSDLRALLASLGSPLVPTASEHQATPSDSNTSTTPADQAVTESDWSQHSESNAELSSSVQPHDQQHTSHHQQASSSSRFVLATSPSPPKLPETPVARVPSATLQALASLADLTAQHVMFEERYVRQLRSCTTLPDDHTVAGHPVVAVDCEMVETADDDMALARVSAVGFDGKQLMDFFVLPCHVDYIVDCRTHVTGIDKKMLRNKGIPLSEAKERFLSCVGEESFLVGHALEHDLLALGVKHGRVIDSALLYPIKNPRRADFCHGLDFLTQQVLNRDMDRKSRGGVHDSIEDARNALDLVKHLVKTTNGEALHPAIPARSSTLGRAFSLMGREIGFAASLRARQYQASVTLAQQDRPSKPHPPARPARPVVAQSSQAPARTILPGGLTNTMRASLASASRARVAMTNKTKQKKRISSLLKKCRR